MIRTTKRAFRYIFPILLIISGVFFFDPSSKANDKMNEVDLKNNNLGNEIKEELDTAKGLKLSSYNPENDMNLLVNSEKARKDGKKVFLSNPKGIFEKEKDKSIITAARAEYLESSGEFDFLDKVDFNHSSGLKAHSTNAKFITSSDLIKGKDGIDATYKNSKLNGNTYTIQTKTGKISVKGNACLIVKH